MGDVDQRGEFGVHPPARDIAPSQTPEAELVWELNDMFAINFAFQSTLRKKSFGTLFFWLSSSNDKSGIAIVV